MFDVSTDSSLCKRLVIYFSFQSNKCPCINITNISFALFLMQSYDFLSVNIYMRFTQKLHNKRSAKTKNRTLFNELIFF